MPELPEVEAARRLLERGCVGKIILKAVVGNDDKVFEVSPEEVRRALEGRRVVAVHRKGKYLWLELDNAEGPWPLLHFGMTGGIVVQKMGVTKYKRIHLESDPDEWPPRFTKLELDLEGGAKLAFVDARRFARVKLMVNPHHQEPLSRLGFDVLDELPSVEEFTAAVRKRVAKAPGLKIKALLLDQEFCSGIGNWVGDEVLYQARIHPEQAAASLDDAALAALHTAIRSVVVQAVEAEADSDRFPRDWIFHYRWTNKKPSSINGHKIEFVTVGSRTSAFVPALQKLNGNGEGSGGGGGGGRAKARGKAGGPAGGKRGGPGSSRQKKKTGSESEDEDEDSEDEQEEVEEADSDGDDGAAVTTATRSRRTSAGKAAGKAQKKAGGGKKGVGKAASIESDAEDEADPSHEGSEEVDEEEIEEDDGADHSDYSEEKRGRKKKRARTATRTAAPAKKRATASAATAASAPKAKRSAPPRARKARA